MIRGKMLLLVGPSGCGKTTVQEHLVKESPRNVLSIGSTTREPRSGEIEGVSYFFLTPEAFYRVVEDGGMLEHALVFGNSYGTPSAPVEGHLAAGRNVIKVVDWQGARLLKARLAEDALGVFLAPPRIEDLEERLIARGDAVDAVAKRMASAEAEMSHMHEFEHVVVNDELSRAVAAVRSLL